MFLIRIQEDKKGPQKQKKNKKFHEEQDILSWGRRFLLESESPSWKKNTFFYEFYLPPIIVLKPGFGYPSFKTDPDTQRDDVMSIKTIKMEKEENPAMIWPYHSPIPLEREEGGLLLALCDYYLPLRRLEEGVHTKDYTTDG